MAEKKILIIDDSLTIREMLSAMLSKMGFEAFVAEDGWQGEAVAKAIQPDLILCDLEMPLKNGVETCASIRSVEKLKAVPIVILTGSKSRDDFQRALDSGATDYMLKPFKENELLDKLRKYLNAKDKKVKRKVLIIDDSKTVRSILAKDISQLGLEILTAEDGWQGEAVAKAAKPDVIFCDLEMPLKNGFDTCKAIRKTKGLEKTPIIVITAKGSQEALKQAISCGASDYIVKPYNKAEMIGKLELHLENCSG